MVRQAHHEVVELVPSLISTPDLVLSLSKDGQRALLDSGEGRNP